MRPVLLAAALSTATVLALWFPVSVARERLRSSDFPNFYAGGVLVRRSGGRELYRANAQRAVLAAIEGRPGVAENFLHPPFEAWLIFAPLAHMPLELASRVWSGLLAALLGACSLLLLRSFPRLGWRPLLAFAFFPSIVVLTLEQDSFLVLLAAVLAWRNLGPRPFLAGLALSLMAVKFQFLSPLVLLLLLEREFGCVLGVLAGVAALLSTSVAALGWSWVADYVQILRQAPADPSVMVGAAGLVSRWTQAVHPWSAAASLALLGVGGALLCREHWDPRLRFAATLLLALLAAPYSHLPDLVLALLPLALIADYALEHRRRWLLAAAAAYFAVPFVALAGSAWVFLMFPATLALFLAVLQAEIGARRARDDALRSSSQGRALIQDS
jgi:hypothetical protein